MTTNEIILKAAKDNDYSLAHHDLRLKIYIFRDRNLTNAVRIGYDDVEHMLYRLGEKDTVAWLNKKFI